MQHAKKQNVTISLDTQVVMKAKILAAKRSTSISGMLAEQVEALVNQDDARERAIASSLARLRRGLDLGGGKLVSRDSLHER
jgi:predicted transcriptional regulator